LRFAGKLAHRDKMLVTFEPEQTSSLSMSNEFAL
jgi:hypothetical protein